MTDLQELLKRVSFVSISLLISLGAIACSEKATSPESAGGDEATTDSTPTPEEMTPEDFVAEADAICLRSAVQIAETENQYTQNTTRKQSIKIEGETDKLIKERLAALEELEPPADLADDYEAYLDLRRQAVGVYGRRTAAFKKKDNDEVKKLDSQIQRLVDRLSKAGRDIGFFACANRLPRDDEREVIANLKEYFSQPSARTCKKLATERLVEALAGTETPCPVALMPSKKVSVDDIAGVEEVRAEAVVVGDAYGETKIDVDLLYENGTYRVSGYEGRT